LNASGKAVDRKYVDVWAPQFGLMEIWKAVQERAALFDGSEEGTRS
jgi:hypothetical protein